MSKILLKLWQDNYVEKYISNEKELKSWHDSGYSQILVSPGPFGIKFVFLPDSVHSVGSEEEWDETKIEFEKWYYGDSYDDTFIVEL